MARRWIELGLRCHTDRRYRGHEYYVWLWDIVLGLSSVILTGDTEAMSICLVVGDRARP